MTTAEEKKLIYYGKLIRKMNALKDAMIDLNEVWLQDSENDIDANDILAKEYPFDDSFDDMVLNVKNWVDSTAPFILDEIRIAEGHDPEIVRKERRGFHTMLF